jgi:hypothetical protein
MTSLARKFGLVIAAALALALVPGVTLSVAAWGQTKPAPSAPAATGQTGAKGATGNAKGVTGPGAKGATAKSSAPAAPTEADTLKKAGQMKTEAGRRMAAQEEQKAAQAKAAEAAAKSGKAPEPVKNTAPKTSGFIIEKGDPFELPIKPPPAAVSPQELPPGQAGLMASQAELQGIVKMQGGNRAVVRGPHDRTYFLKVNDKIYNARVTRITDDAIYFEESTVDPMGKVLKREIAKTMPSEKKP